MLKLNLQKFAVTGIGFDNIPYHAYTWADYDDDPLNRTTSMIVDYPSPNQIAFREGSRLRIGGHKMKLEGDQLISLPATVDVDTTFYFFIEIDTPNQKYSDIKMVTVEPIERGDYEGKLICPFGQVKVAKGNTNLSELDETGIPKINFQDYLVNLAENPIQYQIFLSTFGGGTIHMDPFEIMGKRYKPSDFKTLTFYFSDRDVATATNKDYDFVAVPLNLRHKHPSTNQKIAFLPLIMTVPTGQPTAFCNKVFNLDDDWSLTGTDANNQAASQDAILRTVIFEGLNPFACGTPIV
jgi:hypothetical protein